MFALAESHRQLKACARYFLGAGPIPQPDDLTRAISGTDKVLVSLARKPRAHPKGGAS